MNVEVADEIEKLSSLRERGIISKKGYDHARAQLLSGRDLKASDEIEKLYLLLGKQTINKKEFEKAVSALLFKDLYERSLPTVDRASRPSRPGPSYANSLSTLIGIVCLIGVLIAFIPLLGSLNWFILPIALVGLIVGLFSQATVGRNINIAVLIVGALRLMVGGGVL